MTAPFAHPRPGLDPTASPTPGALDRPGGDGTSQTAPVTDPPADWVAFAAALLDALHHASWAGWSHAAPVTLDVPEAAPESSENTGDEEPACADDEESLDALIDAIMDGRDIDAPSAPPVPRPRTIWRPRPVTLLAVLRLARSFSTANNMAEALAAPGGLTLLASGSAALDWTLLKLLETATSTAAIWPDTLPTPVVMLAEDAVNSGSIDRQRVLADLSTKARDAIEQAEPVVVLTTVAGTTPKPLRNLRPCVKSLAPFDREMLGPMLQWAYPDEEIGSAMEMIPEDLALSRLGPDALTLALRAADATQAARALREALTPARTEGLGLEAFPLPQEVRAPVMQVVRDLCDWQAGRLDWHDVTRGVLVVGPPGSGKTQLARMIGQEAGVSVVAASLSKWSAKGARGGEVLRAMQASFATAAEQAPAVLFIDELDAFGDRARPSDHNSSYTDYIVTALLDLVDGFHGHEGVLVMGATNHVSKLDKALIRPGRFDHVVTLPYPTLDLLPQAWRWQLGSDLPQADLSGLAAASIGMSGADIAAAVRAARALARLERRNLALADLEAILAKERPALPEQIGRTVAVHETGHAIVAVATGIACPTLLALHDAGGVTEATVAKELQDGPHLTAHLAVTLAGRAAECLVYGAPSAGSGGDPESDLAIATRNAAALEASFGLGHSLVWLGTPDSALARLSIDGDLRARVEHRLVAAEARATEILQANQPLLAAIAEDLYDAGLLSGAKLARHLAQVVPEDNRSPRARRAALECAGSLEPDGKALDEGPDQ